MHHKQINIYLYAFLIYFCNISLLYKYISNTYNGKLALVNVISFEVSKISNNIDARSNYRAKHLSGRSVKINFNRT